MTNSPLSPETEAWGVVYKPCAVPVGGTYWACVSADGPLRYMFPSLVCRDQGYVASVDSVLRAEASIRFTLARASAYIAHLGSRKPCIDTSLARLAVMAASVLLYAIVNIVRLSAEEKVCRIAARGIVTSMQDFFAGWYRAIGQYVGGTVCYLGFSATNAERAIPAFVASGLPLPTLVGRALFDFLPKAFSQRTGGRGRVVSADKPKRFALAYAVPAVGFFGNISLFATTAVAVAVWYFVKWELGLGKLWGSIHAVFSASNAIGQARELQLAWHFLLGSTRVSIAQVSA